MVLGKTSDELIETLLEEGLFFLITERKLFSLSAFLTVWGVDRVGRVLLIKMGGLDSIIKLPVVIW